MHTWIFAAALHVKVNSRVDKIFIDEFASRVSQAAGKYKGREECNSMAFACRAKLCGKIWTAGGILENESMEEDHNETHSVV